MKGIIYREPMKPRRKIIEYEIMPSKTRKFDVIYLTKLYKTKYTLKKHLRLLLEKPKTEKDVYILEYKKGNVFIYSFGKTLNKAICEMRWHLVELYEELISISYKKMGPVLIETKKFLEEYIEERSNRHGKI